METAFEHLDGRHTWTVSTDERTWKNKLEKLAEKYPEDVELIAKNKDGSVLYHIPVKWLKVRPPVKRDLTDEQRAELAERIKNAREAKG